MQVAIDGVPVLDAARMQTVLTDARGRSRPPLIDRCEIEARGPLRATIRFDGFFEARRRTRCRFQARVSFFAGTSFGASS